MARKDNISFYSSRVEQERKDLIALKKSGNYNLFSHLDEHPVAGLVKKGARLPDSHPLMQLKSRQSA